MDRGARRATDHGGRTESDMPETTEHAGTDGAAGKESACNAGDKGNEGLIPGSGRFSWKMKWQPTPAFLPGESHGPRSLTGCGPWGHIESDTTEQLNTGSFMDAPYALRTSEVRFPSLTGILG